MNEEIPKHKTLIPATKIKSRLRELAQQISYDYRGKELTAICILKGSFVFFADLIREIDVPLSCEFLGLSSYVGTQSTGEVKVTLDITEPLQDKHVLVVEDIIDSGITINYILNSMAARKPASIRCCSLIHKPDSDRSGIKIDYVGFKINDEFVVGYGLDYNERLRGLPYIGYIQNEH